ncbi:hypothetical protein J1N35_014424 [Gossypium stocksii]|uniref:Uncharacterized protein n=1 Tax=Gossypium stocksii TaxID=47602 RepID=A0A9D4A7K7_9ROSI|nr:hypothetical protein J1N35_014424 [Gossypium stocksii]
MPIYLCQTLLKFLFVRRRILMDYNKVRKSFLLKGVLKTNGYKRSINVGRIILKEIQNCARKKARKFDEPSTESKSKVDSINEIEEVESEGELNNLEPRVEPNVTEPVKPSVNLELTILMTSSSNTMNKLEFSTMMDMWKVMHSQQ